MTMSTKSVCNTNILLKFKKMMDEMDDLNWQKDENGCNELD